MLARSFASYFWAPLGAVHPHDDKLLTELALESALASDQSNDKRNTTSSHRGDDNDANTGGTVGATTSATSRRCYVCAENGDDKTHLDRGFGHDTTHDTTRSDRRGGRQRGGRRAHRVPAGVPACARAVFVNARVQLGSIFVCVSTAARLPSLTRQASLYNRKTPHFPVGTAIDEGGDLRAQASLRNNHNRTEARRQTPQKRTINFRTFPCT